MTARRGGARRPAQVGPRVVVCAGGGGVGKTTTSAALGVALAQRGLSTLIVTIDPARRLASAMGVPIGDEVSQVPWDGTSGRLHALMPDPRDSLRAFVETIFEGQPEAKAHLLHNRIYAGLADAAAGVHELVAMTRVANAAAGGAFDVIVVDTAPSRHAVDFITYPARLAALLGGRTVAWLAGLADRAEGRSSGGGILAWGAGRVDALLARVTGPHLVRDTASLFGDLTKGRERFVALAAQSAELLLGERTTYLLVAAPTAAARDDALYLHARLAKLGRAPRAVLLNRADVGAESSLEVLRREHGVPRSVVDVVVVLEAERLVRAAAADRFAGELAAALPGIPTLRASLVEASAPEEVVARLATQWAPHLDALIPELPSSGATRG